MPIVKRLRYPCARCGKKFPRLGKNSKAKLCPKCHSKAKGRWGMKL